MTTDLNPLNDELLQKLQQANPIDIDALPKPSDSEPARVLEEILNCSTHESEPTIFPDTPNKGELLS